MNSEEKGEISVRLKDNQSWLHPTLKEHVVAKNELYGHIHSLHRATEGFGENKGVNEKMDSDEIENILDTTEHSQSRLDSNPVAGKKKPKKPRTSTKKSEQSDENKGTGEKTDSDIKEILVEALKESKPWLDSKEIEGICAPVFEILRRGSGLDKDVHENS